MQKKFCKNKFDVMIFASRAEQSRAEQSSRSKKEIPMKLAIFITTAFLLSAPQVRAQGCRWKENCNCQVPGSTKKWHLAYCSYKIQNENLESEAVQKCMSTTFAPGGDNCAQNIYWKNEMCKVFHPGNSTKEENCKRKFFIPKVVGT